MIKQDYFTMPSSLRELLQDDRTGYDATTIFSDACSLVFLFYPWVNKGLVTRHLFAVSGSWPSQKIEFG